MPTLLLFPESAIVDLTQILEDENPGIQASAAFTLGKFGRKAEPALPLLREILERSDDETRRDTFERAIVAIEGGARVPTPERSERDFRYLIEQIDESARRRTIAEEEYDAGQQAC